MPPTGWRDSGRRHRPRHQHPGGPHADRDDGRDRVDGTADGPARDVRQSPAHGAGGAGQLRRRAGDHGRVAAWLRIDPGVAAGFLVLAVCPGAPFGPAVAAVARGDVASATGLMVVLAGSSALAAPLLLPRSCRSGAGMEGVQDRARWRSPARCWSRSSCRRSRPLCFTSAGPTGGAAAAAGGRRQPGARRGDGRLVIVAHASLLLRIRAHGVAAMAVLLALSLGAGWWAGEAMRDCGGRRR